MTVRPLSRSRIASKIGLSVVGIVLVWIVLTKGLVAYLAQTAPDAALRIDPAHPAALLRLVDEALNAAQLQTQRDAPHRSSAPTNPSVETPSSGDLIANLSKIAAETIKIDPAHTHPEVDWKRLRSRVELALNGDPLNAQAMRILGQLAIHEGDETRAKAFMRAAAARSLRESGAVYWLMQKSLAGGEMAKALYYSDILLRTRPQLARFIAPALAPMAEDKTANSELKKQLAANPPWRSAFFSALMVTVTDGRTPLGLFLALKETPSPPTIEELRTYLNFLIANKMYELAYYAWLQFLPLEQLRHAGLLINGSFEAEPTGLPFDWVIAQGRGVTVDRVRRPDKPGQQALYIEFGLGRAQYKPVTQMTVLAPGSYSLTGSYKSQISGRRGMVWRVKCVEAANGQIGESQMILSIDPTWKEFDVPFSVPSTDCRAQSIRLDFDARSPSEKMAAGTILFDELKITRQ